MIRQRPQHRFNSLEQEALSVWLTPVGQRRRGAEEHFGLSQFQQRVPPLADVITCRWEGHRWSDVRRSQSAIGRRLSWVSAPTQHGTGRRLEGLTLKTAALQVVAVGRAGVTGEAAGPVQRAQEQEHRALVVTDKIRFTCRRRRHCSECVCVCVNECVRAPVCEFTCEDGFGTPWLIRSTVCIEVDVTVSSSESKRCRTTPKRQNRTLKCDCDAPLHTYYIICIIRYYVSSVFSCVTSDAHSSCRCEERPQTWRLRGPAAPLVWRWWTWAPPGPDLKGRTPLMFAFMGLTSNINQNLNLTGRHVEAKYCWIIKKKKRRR